jgi:hypothetical protein
MAVRFDADESYTSTSSPPVGSAYTVMCWAMVSVDRNTWSAVWSSDSSTSNYVYLATDSDGVTMKAWTLVGGNERIINGPAMTVGTWYRFALVVNGATATLYHGTASGALSAPQSTTWQTIASTTTFRIGADPFSGEWLNGRVAAVKHWSVALTQAEVERELSQYLPDRTANLVRFHPFVANETADHSGNTRTLSGGATTTREDGPPIPWHAASPRVVLPAAGGGAVPVSGTDTASLAEVATVSVTGSGTDAASATETVALTAAPAAADTAALAEGVSVSASPSTADTATLAEAALTGLATVDDASLSEAGVATATASTTDSASLSEAVAIGSTAVDAGALTEAATVSAASSASDTAALSENVTLVVVINATDAAATADSSSLNSGGNPSGNDSLTLTEDASVLVLLTAAEASALADATSVAVLATATDSAATTDTSAVLWAFSGTDTFALNEGASLTVQAAGVDHGAFTDGLSVTATPTSADQFALADAGTTGAAGVEPGHYVSGKGSIAWVSGESSAVEWTQGPSLTTWSSGEVGV